jgi:hypothetical protein
MAGVAKQMMVMPNLALYKDARAHVSIQAVPVPSPPPFFGSFLAFSLPFQFLRKVI